LVGSLMTDDEADLAARCGRLFSCAEEKIYHDDTTSTTQECPVGGRRAVVVDFVSTP